MTSMTTQLRRGRAWVLLALLGACLLLPGCGMRVLGRRIDLLPGGSKADGRQEKMLEARGQAALNLQEPFWHYRIAELHLEADSLAHAEAALKSCLERNDHYVPALSLLSKLYYDAGRHREAVTLLEAVRSRPRGFEDGTTPEALLAGLALHYDALDQLAQAAALIDGMPAQGRKETRSAMVFVTLRGEKPDSASAWAAKGVSEAPRSAVNQNNYGIARLRAGDPAAARRAFLAAIDLDARLPGPYYNLAILEKFYTFDDEAAARWLKAYRARSSQDPDSLFGMFAKSDPKRIADEGRRP